MKLKDTLNLPQTEFPMRGNLVQREPLRLEHWKKLGLYQLAQQRRAGQPAFILHDGPPFTNGDVHLGTALNKVLKDGILRYKTMRGFRTPYIPGWDCHGLPIEHKVALRLRDEGRDLEPAALREECAAFSASFIETQRQQFERLGVLADWEREYRTMSPAYEATILRTFAEFVEQDQVYRSKKPVYWSIPCETALAEAEVEYQDHTSPSIWVKFPVAEGDAQAAALGLPARTSVVIWTTTPWTIPANLAIALHPKLSYQVLKDTATGEHFLVVAELAENFAQVAGLKLEPVASHLGADLEGLQTRHPLINRPSPLVTADYVTTEQGTGCVHTAPGHGMDDYLTGLKYGLEIYCPIDDQGRYIDDGQVPPELVGVTVLETGQTCPANIEVLKLLARENALLAKQKYRHSYPHCWRSKTPVVFRAMNQWFVSLDKGQKRQEVLKAIEEVQWVPDWGIKRIRAAVENRPDWCISRQRSWGVPLPVFYRPDGTPLLEAGVIRQLADKIAAQGTNLWFEATPEQLLEGIELPEGFVAAELKKGQDTLDVWIDSGCSHRAVLQQTEDLHWPADLYLEGSDQHRGWFQSSIWTGVIADGAAPYKQVLTHGFIVEENGEKISKSKGAMSSDGWVQQYGADILRLWVSSQDFRGDIKLSEKHFKRVQGTYRGIRNTLMYQLGNLQDFDPQAHAVPFEQLEPLDQWALGRTAAFVEAMTRAYDAFEFHRAFQELDYYTGVTLSRLYHDILKDRLYTSGRDWKERRSAQTAIHAMFEALVKVAAPILSFTADEAWCFFRTGKELAEDSIHLQDWPTLPQAWAEAPAVAEIEQLLGFREQVNEKLEGLRAQKAIGRSLDAKVTVAVGASDSLAPLLQKYAEHLAELFIVSEVKVVAAADDEPTGIDVAHADGVQCPRSWRWVSELVDAGPYGAVSPRDREALLGAS